MNKVIMMGRLTKDPETRTTQDGKTITRFSLAVDRRYVKEATDFFEMTTFGKTAEFAAKYLKKGTKILTEGTVQNNNYTNKDGQKVYGFSFVVDSIEFAESKGSTEEKPDWQPVDAMDGLPFN